MHALNGMDGRIRVQRIRRDEILHHLYIDTTLPPMPHKLPL